MVSEQTDEQSPIRKSTLKNLSSLPEFLLHPRRTITPLIEGESPLIDSMKLAGAMLAIGAGGAAAMKPGTKVELSSLAFITAGTVSIWMIYGIFLHAFAFLAGARRGFRYTVIAYLYVIGFLQPVFVAILWGIVWMYPDAVTYREITAGLGGSSLAKVISGDFISTSAASFFRCLSGGLILTYFTACLATTQKISLVRSFIASFASFLFFVVLFVLMILISSFGLDHGIFMRLSLG